jgi:transcriptional regulator with XRE-family HTH domain
LSKKNAERKVKLEKRAPIRESKSLRRSAVTSPQREPNGSEKANASGKNQAPRTGARLKHARLVKGYTLRQLAQIVDCSESMISKLENDKLAPSISMLHRLTAALDTSIAELFLEAENSSFDSGVTVFRADRRARFQVEPELEQAGSWFERILPIHRSGLLQANILNIPEGASTNSFVTHEGEEFGYMIKGELEVVVDQRSHFLRQGDVIYFSSALPHGYRNTSESVAQVLWINTPPTL